MGTNIRRKDFAQKRQKGESLQKLYQAICRLITLAYPGPATALLDIVGRDTFLEALDNQTLRVRILEKEPKNLDEALNMASLRSVISTGKRMNIIEERGKQSASL